MSELHWIVLNFKEEGNNLFQPIGNLAGCVMIKGRRRKDLMGLENLDFAFIAT